MENNLTYTINGDYMIPDLKIEVPEQPLGKYGRRRHAMTAGNSKKQYIGPFSGTR